VAHIGAEEEVTKKRESVGPTRHEGAGGYDREETPG